ncbi:MAG: hypothetical protein ACI8RD_011294, partial [Bacillariaceae sp.]|jgi:hypothetical protein
VEQQQQQQLGPNLNLNFPQIFMVANHNNNKTHLFHVIISLNSLNEHWRNKKLR